LRPFSRRWPFAIAFTICMCWTARVAPVRAQNAERPSSKPAKAVAIADPMLIDGAAYNRIVARYHGKPLLVTFWATWCEPCRDEYPMMVDLAKKYAGQGLAVFGVSMDDDSDMNLVRHFLAQNQPIFPNYRQKPGIDVDDFYHGVNPNWMGGMPETILYGRDGQIATHFVGEQTRATFEKAIQTILAKPDAGHAAPAPSHASN
jgi:thiol-disulfide isomerase/thioredoxin